MLAHTKRRSISSTIKCEVFFFFSLVTYSITMSCTRIFSCSTNARRCHTYIAKKKNGTMTTTTTTTTTTSDLAKVVGFVGFSELFSLIDSRGRFFLLRPNECWVVNKVTKFKCCDGTNSSLYLHCCITTTITASSTSSSSTERQVVIRSKKILTIRSYE